MYYICLLFIFVCPLRCLLLFHCSLCCFLSRRFFLPASFICLHFLLYVFFPVLDCYVLFAFFVSFVFVYVLCYSLCRCFFCFFCFVPFLSFLCLSFFSVCLLSFPLPRFASLVRSAPFCYFIVTFCFVCFLIRLVPFLFVYFVLLFCFIPVHFVLLSLISFPFMALSFLFCSFLPISLLFCYRLFFYSLLLSLIIFSPQFVYLRPLRSFSCILFMFCPFLHFNFVLFPFPFFYCRVCCVSPLFYVISFCSYSYLIVLSVLLY